MSLLLEEIYLPCYDTPTETFPLRATTVKAAAVTGTETFALLPYTVKFVAMVFATKASTPEPFVDNT